MGAVALERECGPGGLKGRARLCVVPCLPSPAVSKEVEEQQGWVAGGGRGQSAGHTSPHLGLASASQRRSSTVLIGVSEGPTPNGRRNRKGFVNLALSCVTLGKSPGLCAEFLSKRRDY